MPHNSILISYTTSLSMAIVWSPKKTRKPNQKHCQKDYDESSEK